VITITIVDDGFTIGGDRTAHVRWDEITKISTYKVDLFTYDQVCVGVHTFRSANCIELQEEWEGFLALTEELERRFNIDKDWWSKVALPAFDENYAVLYAR
jgi:hypothetical protein